MIAQSRQELIQYAAMFSELSRVVLGQHQLLLLPPTTPRPQTAATTPGSMRNRQYLIDALSPAASARKKRFPMAAQGKQGTPDALPTPASHAACSVSALSSAVTTGSTPTMAIGVAPFSGRGAGVEAKESKASWVSPESLQSSPEWSQAASKTPHARGASGRFTTPKRHHGGGTRKHAWLGGDGASGGQAGSPAQSALLLAQMSADLQDRDAAVVALRNEVARLQDMLRVEQEARLEAVASAGVEVAEAAGGAAGSTALVVTAPHPTTKACK